jgi:hypothetical protein
MFCFDDLEEFIDTLESLPSEVAESIRHISVLQGESHYFKQPFDAFKGMKYRLCEVTQRMTNLATLEISPCLGDLYRLNALNLKKRLTSATVYHVEIRRCKVYEKGRRDLIYARVSKPTSLPGPTLRHADDCFCWICFVSSTYGPA